MSEFKLGPLQEKWLQYLEQHPEQQIKEVLGEQDEDGEIGMCCLGAAAIVCDSAEWKDSVLTKRKRLFSGDSDQWFENYNLIGLRSFEGVASKPFCKEKFVSLVVANDTGLTWPEIAAEIRKDPKNFFTESK